MAKLQGFTGQAFNNMLIGSGAVVLNPVDETEATLRAAVRGDATKGEKLGGTTGGVSFNAEPDWTDLGEDLDGLASALRGAMVMNRVDVTMEATVVEFQPGKIRKLNPFLDEVPIFSDAVAASTTRGTTNSGITITAKVAGTGGNSISYAQVVSGNSTPLSVSVVNNAITVNVATDATGVATSTANQVITAINGSVAASALVIASLPATSNGTGVVTASAAANLTGGSAGTNRVGTDYVPRGYVKDSDHIDKVAVLFESKDKDIRLAIILYNCLVTSDFSIEGEGENEKIGVEVTLTAMSGANNYDLANGTYPPAYKIRDFSVPAAA